MAATTTVFGHAVHPSSPTFPQSLRLPWTRAGTSGVVALMLPFTWVLQLDGCTETVVGHATGYDLLSELHFTTPDLALAIALFFLAVFAPRAAWYAGKPRARLGVHLAGLGATTILVARGVSLVLGTTEVRAIQPAGAIVVVALAVAFLDAIARLAMGFMERTDQWLRQHARDG
jgi:hypothetical protein